MARKNLQTIQPKVLFRNRTRTNMTQICHLRQQREISNLKNIIPRPILILWNIYFAARYPPFVSGEPYTTMYVSRPMDA